MSENREPQADFGTFQTNVKKNQGSLRSLRSNDTASSSSTKSTHKPKRKWLSILSSRKIVPILSNKYDLTPKDCIYCDGSIFSYQHDVHVATCKLDEVYCQLCDGEMGRGEYLEHIYECSKRCYKRYYTLDCMELSSACVSKYNKRYPDNVKRELNYTELIPAARKRVYFHLDERNRNFRFSQFTIVKKRLKIFVDMINSLTDTTDHVPIRLSMTKRRMTPRAGSLAIISEE